MKENLKGNERIVKKPQEGIVFEVNPLAIDLDLFECKRKDLDQEKTRQLILDAYMEVFNNLKYTKPFKTLIPEKNWDIKTVKELKQVAINLGGRVANWVEQALEWAQRISNGETWEELCNNYDTANWYRLVVWKRQHNRLIGGSQEGKGDAPPTSIGRYYYDSDEELTFNAVPLIVFDD